MVSCSQNMGNDCGVRGVCGDMSRGSDIIARPGNKLPGRFHMPRTLGAGISTFVDGAVEKAIPNLQHLDSMHVFGTLTTNCSVVCTQAPMYPKAASFELNPILGIGARLQDIG